MMHVARFPFDKRLPDLDFSLPDKNEAMAVLAAFLEQGTITPIIDRTYPLSQVSEAMRYMQEGRAVGKVVIVPQAPHRGADRSQRSGPDASP